MFNGVQTHDNLDGAAGVCRHAYRHVRRHVSRDAWKNEYHDRHFQPALLENVAKVDMSIDMRADI